jgi:cytochrome c553
MKSDLRNWWTPALRSAFLIVCASAVVAAVTHAPASAQRATLKERLEVCAGCHGEDGNSRMEKIPSLAGQPEFFLLNQLVLMREGVRRIEQMDGLMKDLKDDELQAIAAHFSKLTPKASEEKVDPELVKRGQGLAVKMRCASCHLPTMAGQEQMPRLARQRIDYMVYAMKAFRDNARSGADTAMTAVIVGVPDAELTALAHYVAQR